MKPMRPIQQLDYDTDEVIAEYTCADEAADDNYLCPEMIRQAIYRRGGKMSRLRLKFRYKI